MSKAAHGPFTGISDQADIALLYLLRACKRLDFQKIIVEGEEWEDFALVFDEHNEDYEVKSQKREFTFGNIKKIITKELKKQYGEKDLLKIIVRKLSVEFKDNYEYVRDNLYWINQTSLSQNPMVTKFMDRGWSEEEMFFLTKVEIIEFGEITNIHKQISEYFALEDPFYLSQHDQENLVARSFKKIMYKGKTGGTISRKDLLDMLDIFKKNITEKSESFSPDRDLGEKIGKIKYFLSSETNLQQLLVPKYLSPISSKPRLIFYLADKLEQSQFHVNSFKLFIEEILLKQDYIGLALRILEKKRTQDKIDEEYLLDFLIINYKKLFYDFNYDEALKIIRGIVKNDKQGLFVDKILDFLEKDILIFFEKEKQLRRKRKKRGVREEKYVATILKLIYERGEHKKSFIDFVFKYFVFTGDDYENVIGTHPIIYSMVKEFIKDNLKANFDFIIKKISSQFNCRYNNEYNGYEWNGSGISQAGRNYSISDKGIVRLLFKPLFEELYRLDLEGAWEFFKEKILNKAKKRATINNPIYLKRALVPILIERLEKENLSKKEKNETFEYLKNILWMKKGTPETPEVIFDRLRNCDFSKIGFDKVIELIKIDSVKYKRKDKTAGYPTNLFVISTLINLIKLNHKAAKDFFIALLKKPDFLKRDWHYDSLELMVDQGIPESDPDFTYKIIKNIGLERYLNSYEGDISWNKSGIITGLITRDWQDGTDRGQKIITSLLKSKVPSEKVLEFLSGPIQNLAQKNSLKTYKLFKPYLKDKHIFRNTFKNNDYARQSVVWLADELAKSKHYEEAKTIIELCIDDPDPRTHNRREDFNRHLQIKEGNKELTITTVRGTVACALQQFVISNDIEWMKYALDKTVVLLDLKGELARKLNYPEPDLYVRQQALFPFIKLSHIERRKILGKNLSNYIKATAFEIIETIDTQIKSGEANPNALIEHLVDVFSYIRDISTEEAKTVLSFFEYHNIPKAHFLFIYFAVYREKQYKVIPFDSRYFKSKLCQICQENDDFRQSLAWEFWRTCEEDKEKNTKYFDNIEKYWKLLFKKYHHDTFDHLYRTLEITLTVPAKYVEHKKLFKEALKKEIEYFKTHKMSISLWGPGEEIFQILKEHNEGDFLEVFYHLIKSLDGNENIHYFSMMGWIAIFVSIKPKTKKQKILYDNTNFFLRKLYPEYLDSL